MKTTYHTWVNANLCYIGSSLEDAVRTWDAETYNRAGDAIGGISVIAHDGNVMVRDGWVLHVREDGTVYLNPRMG